MDFTFYQHDGSTFGWIKIQHGSTSDVYRSQSVTLNK